MLRGSFQICSEFGVIVYLMHISRSRFAPLCFSIAGRFIICFPATVQCICIASAMKRQDVCRHEFAVKTKKQIVAFLCFAEQKQKAATTPAAATSETARAAHLKPENARDRRRGEETGKEGVRGEQGEAEKK